MSQHYLSALFTPQSIAIFGAEDACESLGSFVFRNLIDAGFRGKIYPISPKTDKVLGHQAYDSLTQVEQTVDLAVITSSVDTVEAQVRECGEQGVKMLLILPAGFREAGFVGQKREDAVMQLVRHYGMRLMGPNCLGFVRPLAKVNLTFGNNQIEKGSIALLSQSGSICTAILDWAELNGIGFSTVISTGINADLDFGDYLDYLANDGATKSILLYMEGIHTSRRFMSALRAAARIKPVIVLKTGRHESAAQASFSHTGSLVGSDEVFSAALERSGVVRVKTLTQLFAASRILAGAKTLPKGETIAIITNGGGPGVMATDCAADMGVELSQLSDETLKKLNAVLPNEWSQSNPIDLSGDAAPDRYREAVQICLDAPEVHTLIVILTPQAMTRPTDVARVIADLARASRKPVLVSWMGGAQVIEARRLFNQAKVPQFKTLESCIEAFSYKAAYQRTQRMLLQVPGKLKRGFQRPDKAAAQALISSVMDSGRKTLTEPESYQVMDAFNIPHARAGVANSADEAVEHAEQIGYPVVLKILSASLTHKSDVGGVRLNLVDEAEVRRAYIELIEHVSYRAPDLELHSVTVEKMIGGAGTREVMVGLKRDPVFGPVITFGAGGTFIEAFDDVKVALPPLNRKLSRDLIYRTRISKLLGAYRHLPAAKVEAIEDILLRLSNLACEMPCIEEMDINPLIVDDQGAIAVDARIKVSKVEQSRPYDHLAIHPYPVNLIKQTTLKNGEEITIRPIRPEDAEIEKHFVDKLSSEAKYFRFMSVVHEITPQMLVRFTQIDYEDEMALVAVKNGETEVEIGVARYATTPDHESCEFAIVINQDYEGLGLAYQLMSSLIEIARDRGLKAIFGEILANNRHMLNFMMKLGFSIKGDPDDPGLKIATLKLND